MVALYVASCAISYLIIVSYINFYNKKDIWFLLTFISLLVCNLGYLTLALSRTVEEALLANRFAYLGSVFLPFFLFMTIMKVCRFRFTRRLPFVLSLLNAAVLIITTSAGYSDIYYANVSYAAVSGVGMLVKEYGPLHASYYVFLGGYFAAMVGVIVRSFFKRKVVPYKHALKLAIAVFLNVGLYFTEKATHLEFELLPFSYIVTAIFLLLIYKELEDYNIDGVVQNSLSADSFGVALFDPNRLFRGANDAAVQILPQLAELKLDEPIPESASSLQNAVLPALTGTLTPKNATCRCGDRIYRLTANPFYRNGNPKGKHLGTAVVIADDTPQQEYLSLLSNYKSRLEEEVAQKTRHILAMHDNLIFGMADMVENRDPNTGGHIKRTSAVVGIFVEHLWGAGYGGLSREFLRKVAKAAPMHDLGKIAIDDAILRKPGIYTAEEYRIMQTHSAKGAEIVGRILRREDDEEFYRIAVNVAHYHHERYDGTGYPASLKGEEIPVESRIMALADVFDALVSKRCYKEARTPKEAFSIIEGALGGQFDPELGRLFLACKSELNAYCEKEIEE